MKNLLFLFLLLVLFIQSVNAQEYSTLSITNFQKDYMKEKVPIVSLLKYDDKSKLPYYGDKIIDVGNGYKILIHESFPYTIEVFKFSKNNLLWVKSFNIYRTKFKSAKLDKKGNLVVELNNYSIKDVYNCINEREKAFDTGDVYLIKNGFTINENGSIINELEGFPSRYLVFWDSFDYNNRRYYIVGEQAYYIGEVILWINYYLWGFEKENGKMNLKDIKYMFSQKNVSDISITSSDKINIIFGNKKMTLKGNKLSFNNLQATVAHLFGNIRHAISVQEMKKELNIYSSQNINNQDIETHYSKLMGSLKKLQKDGNDTILLIKKIPGWDSFNSIVRINGKKIFIKNLDSRLLEDIDSISYNNGVYKIKLKETLEYEHNLYLNDEIRVKEDGTIIEPLKVIKIDNHNRNPIKKFKKYGHDFVKIGDILYLLDDNQLYSTDFRYKEGEHDIQIIDNENYYLKYLKTERIIKEYNYYNNGYNPEKERECDFKFSNGNKFWLKRGNLLWRPSDSDKTYHLGYLFQYSLELPDDFKILDINISKNESIVEINTSLGKVIFIPEEEKIISPEVVVKKKLVKIDKPITVIEKFWENSDLNIDKDVYYFQSSEIK